MRPAMPMRFCLVCTLLLAAWACAWAAGSEPGVLAVVVARDAPERPLAKDALAPVFLRQMTLWPNRETIQPVNLSAAHPLRRVFSERVLGLAPDELDEYWNDQYFHGVFPPYAAESEEAVLRFVAGSPAAIGYVSACAVDGRVRVLFFSTPAGLVPGGGASRHCPPKPP